VDYANKGPPDFKRRRGLDANGGMDTKMAGLSDDPLEGRGSCWVSDASLMETQPFNRSLALANPTPVQRKTRSLPAILGAVKTHLSRPANDPSPSGQRCFDSLHPLRCTPQLRGQLDRTIAEAFGLQLPIRTLCVEPSILVFANRHTLQDSIKLFPLAPVTAIVVEPVDWPVRQNRNTAGLPPTRPARNRQPDTV